MRWQLGTVPSAGLEGLGAVLPGLPKCFSTSLPSASLGLEAGTLNLDGAVRELISPASFNWPV